MDLPHPANVLVLCTGNSARSILGEALFTAHGGGRFRGHSAGSTPKGQPHPEALATLARHGIAADGFSSKSWDVFAAADAPEMHIVITVCDNAANEVCPVWPGAPVSAHWGLPDPAAVTEPAAAVTAAFETAFAQLERRIAAFMALPIDELSPFELAQTLNAIGAQADAAAG